MPRPKGSTKIANMSVAELEGRISAATEKKQKLEEDAASVQAKIAEQKATIKEIQKEIKKEEKEIEKLTAQIEVAKEREKVAAQKEEAQNVVGELLAQGMTMDEILELARSRK